VILGLLSLVAISPVGHAIAIIGMISLIGLPIAFLVIAIPTLFLLTLAGHLTWEAWSKLRAGHRRTALAFAIALLAMVDFFVFRAWRVNAWLDRSVASLVEQDVDTMAPSGPVGALALLRTVRGSFENDTLCDDLCRRLLLTRSAQQVLALTLEAKVNPRDVLGAPWPAEEPPGSLSGTAWRLERRDHCPDAPLKSQRLVKLAEPDRPKGVAFVPPVSTEQLMRLAIAGGNCLIGEPASLERADAMLAYGDIHWPASTFSAGYEAWTDTVGAWRLGFWSRREGFLVRTYQRTSVRWQRLPGAFIPWLENGPELRTANGWVRNTAWLNRSRFEDEPPVAVFMIDRLGLELRPSVTTETGEAATPQASLRSEQAKAVERILASKGAPTQTEIQVITDYLDGIGSPFSQRANEAGSVDARRVLKLLQDQRFPLPSSVVGAVRFAATSEPLLADASASALAGRLAQLPPPPLENRARESWNAQVGATSSALAQLPGPAVQPHRAVALDLMQDRERRAVARNFLSRLDLFGPGIAPDVFAMMDDAAELRDPKTRELSHLRYSWLDVWRAGAQSLCRLAPQMPEGLADLRSRVHALVLSKANVGDVTVVAAMLRMGATQDDIRATLAVDPGNEQARRSFDFTMRRAERDDACR
jgi:hypothetical protein